MRRSAAYAFLDEPRIREIETKVLEAAVAGDEHYVVLEDTVLYPGGGGQPADRGTVAGVVVTRLEKDQGRIRHYLGEAAGAGSKVRVMVDWPRRFDHMQQHTAQHLITAMALDHFGWATRSFHLGGSSSDIELDVESPPPGTLNDLEALCMQAVREAHPVSARSVSLAEYESLDMRGRALPADHSGDVRLVEIESIDITSCGGTHLGNTSEIESLKLLDTEPMRGGTRLRWIAGGRVRARIAEHEERFRELRALLCTGDEGVVEAVEARLEQQKTMGRRFKNTTSLLAEVCAKELAQREGRIAEAHFAGLDAGFLQNLARHFSAFGGSGVALLTAETDKGSFFVLVGGQDSDLDLPVVGSQIAECMGARGGGSGRIYQGKADSLKDRAKALELLRKLMEAP